MLSAVEALLFALAHRKHFNKVAEPPCSISERQSIDGKMVFSEEGNLQTTSTYNLKHLNNGLYFVSIPKGKDTSTSKWVKK